MALAPPRTYVRHEILPSYEIDVAGRHTANLASNFAVRIASATTLVVPAGSGDAAAVISIGNYRRYRETSYTAGHPGGAAGTFDVYVTASADSISASPAPNTDVTNYSFVLVIRAAGSPPTGVDVYRKVATCVWSGSAITSVSQSVTPASPEQNLHPVASTTGETPLRVEGFSTGQSAALMTVARSAGDAPYLSVSAAGQLALSVAGSTGGLVVGGDATLFRSTTRHLALGASTILDLSAAGTTDASAGAAAGDKIALSSTGFGFGIQSGRLVAYVASSAAFAVRPASGSPKSGGSDAVVLGANGTISATGTGKATLALTSTGADTGLTLGGDTTLYRSSLGPLMTDNDLRVVGTLAVGTANTNPGETAVIKQTYTSDTSDTRYGLLIDIESRPVTANLGAGNTGLSTRVDLYDSLATGDIFNEVVGNRATTNVTLTTRNLVGAEGVSAQISTHLSGGVLTDASVFVAQILNLGTGGAITNAYGLRVLQTPLGTTPVTNLYGIYIEHQTIGTAINSALRTNQTSSTVVLDNRLNSSDSVSAFQIDGTGKLSWGPGGSSAIDTNLYRLGSASLATDGALTVGGSLALNSTSAGFVDMVEQGSAPAAPTINHGRLFVQDNGSGKTQLCVRFASGAVQVISTEP